MRPRFRPLALRSTAALLLAVAGFVLAACSSGSDAAPVEPDDGRPRVVASTAIIAEFATRVAGDDAHVEALIPSGVEIHSYDPPTEAARRVARADLLLVNGYNLEEAVLDVIVENRRAGVPLVVASEGLAALAGGDEDHEGSDEGRLTAAGDPHVWLDAGNAIAYVENIREALGTVDPAHGRGYRERAGAYIAELRALDGEIRAEVAAIPADRRTIVVFHDAFQYFSRAYGFDLTAAVLPPSPTQELSAGDVAEIVRLVERRGITAVYAEPQFRSRVIDLVADESGARLLSLYSTPIPGQAESYVAMMRANAGALVEGLAPPREAAR